MSNKRKMDEDDLMEFMPIPLLEVYKEVSIQNKYRVFVDEVITEPSKYRNVINILESATEDDIVEFRLNTPGGNLMTAIQLCNAIENSAATTVAIVDGEVASAGTLFLLACDNVIIMKNTMVMVHPAKFGSGGDVKTVRASIKFQTEYIKDVLYDVYKGFLTDDEFEDMIENSREIWMRQDEITERLRNRQILQLEEAKKALEELENPTPKKKADSKKPKGKKNAS